MCVCVCSTAHSSEQWKRDLGSQNCSLQQQSVHRWRPPLVANSTASGGAEKAGFQLRVRDGAEQGIISCLTWSYASPERWACASCLHSGYFLGFPWSKVKGWDWYRGGCSGPVWNNCKPIKGWLLLGSLTHTEGTFEGFWELFWGSVICSSVQGLEPMTSISPAWQSADRP